MTVSTIQRSPLSEPSPIALVPATSTTTPTVETTIPSQERIVPRSPRKGIAKSADTAGMAAWMTPASDARAVARPTLKAA